MKNLLLLFAFLLPGTSAITAQSWFEHNPQWINYYTQGFSGDGYEYATIAGDTVLNGLQAKVVKRYFNMTWANDFTRICVLRQAGDSIWSWYNGGFHLIYNFSLQVGDTLATPLGFGSSALSRYVIDSTGQMLVSGQSLRFQRVRILYTNPVPNYPCYALIIEKMGMVTGTCYNSNINDTFDLGGYFFFYEPNAAAVDGPSWRFCRFQNEEIAYKISYFACDALSEVSEFRPDEALFSISPNPFNDRFSIYSRSEKPLNSWRLFDLSGQLRLEKVASKDTQIDATALPPGLYILETTSGKHNMTFLKVLKIR